MKKVKVFKQFLIIISLFLLPLNILAYSDYIIAGGNNIGIEINSKGIIIVGFYKVNGKFLKSTPELKVGDRIIKVNYNQVSNINDLIAEIDNNIIDNKVNITFLRDNEEYTSTLNLAMLDGVYKTGIYVKDSLTGIGTLTYIDPETKIYGTLGHEIIEKVTKKAIEVDSGMIFKSKVTGIERSSDGTPGGKLAKFYYNDLYGIVSKNTIYGVYGTYNEIPNETLIKVGSKDDISLGKALIRTVIDNEEVNDYEIEITKINNNHKTKNLVFKITDSKLLSKTGGIVQGMSGSPIIQNDKIVGAVTHVIVDDVKKGYGIFITTMLEEGEK